jgi:hypothetical protein
MMAEFTKKMELKFWDILLPLLTSTTWLRSIIRFFYLPLIKQGYLKRQVAIGFVICMIGTGSGILVFTFSSLI